MGKDIAKVFTHQLDNFIGLKYAVPSGFEKAYTRIRKNLKTFSIIYTMISMVLFFIATFFDKEFLPVFITFFIFGVAAIVIGVFEPKVPVGDKKYKIEGWYMYILLIVMIVIMAYFREEMASLIKTGVFTVIALVAHAVFAKEIIDFTA